MKKLFPFAVLLCLTVSLYAQIPNAGFENWGGLNPIGWISNDVPTSDTPVVQSASPHSGSYAVRLGVGQLSGTEVGGTLTTDNNGSAFYPLSSLPGALHGWYMGNVANIGTSYLSALMPHSIAALWHLRLELLHRAAQCTRSSFSILIL